MIKKILIGLALLIAVFVVIVYRQPDQFRIERSALVAATPEKVFAQVNDLHNWEAWSPWSKLDPAAQNTFEGPEAGVGAIFRWVGNNDVGEGSMTIIESVPGSLVRIRLDFVKPFEDTSTAEFSFQPAGDQTSVTWSMYGENNFMSKAFCLFMDMDEMLGGQFELGLAQLKAVAEAQP